MGISRLTDDAIRHILSLLPTINAAATSQVLDFSQKPFPDDAVFVAFVNEVLIRRRVRSVQKFRLSCNITDVNVLERWIGAAVGPDLQEMHLCLPPMSGRLEFLDGVFTCNSLESLTLKGEVHLWGLPCVHLPSLKNLEVSSDATIVPINTLLAGCPLLETLDFPLHRGDIPEICMPGSLKSLTFRDDPGSVRVIKKLEINTPSLEYLHIYLANLCSEIVVSDFPKIVEAHLDIVNWVPELLKALCRAKQLVLAKSTTRCLLKASALAFPEFCRLLHLDIQFPCFDPGFLMGLLYRCRKLQVLKIRNGEGEFHGRVYLANTGRSGWTQATNDPDYLSDLNILEFRGFQHSADENAFVAFILQNGLALKAVTIHTCIGCDQNEKEHILSKLSTISRGIPLKVF